MSALLIHAQAARILGQSFANRAEQLGDPTGMLTCMADAYLDASDQMLAESAAEAIAYSEAARCTLDHKTMKGPVCPACKAPTK